LTLNPAAGYIVSCEVGVGFVEVLVTDFGPQTIWQTKEPTEPDMTQDEIIGRVLTLLHEAIGKGRASAEKLLGIAVGVPGMVDHASGSILFAPNLKWRDVPLLALLEKESFGAPIFVDNEANMAALGEHYFGASQGYNEILYLSGNVGLGGGFLSNGQLRRGASGMAAEYGHMTVDTHGELCNCGNYGCWETKVSQNSLYKKVIHLVESGPKLVQHSRRENVQILEGHIVVLDMLRAEEVRIGVVDYVRADLRGIASEDPVPGAELVIHTREILVLRQDIRHIDDGVDIERIHRIELGQRYVRVHQFLRVLVDAVSGNDVGDIAG